MRSYRIENGVRWKTNCRRNAPVGPSKRRGIVPHASYGMATVQRATAKNARLEPGPTRAIRSCRSPRRPARALFPAIPGRPRGAQNPPRSNRAPRRATGAARAGHRRKRSYRKSCSNPTRTTAARPARSPARARLLAQFVDLLAHQLADSADGSIAPGISVRAGRRAAGQTRSCPVRARSIWPSAAKIASPQRSRAWRFTSSSFKTSWASWSAETTAAPCRSNCSAIKALAAGDSSHDSDERYLGRTACDKPLCLPLTATPGNPPSCLPISNRLSAERSSSITPDISSATSCASVIEFVGRDFEDQFVVDLQQHPRRRLFSPQPAVDVDHGQLDQIGRRALDDRVDRRAFGKVSLARRAASNAADRAPPAEDGTNITSLRALFQYPSSEIPRPRDSGRNRRR